MDNELDLTTIKFNKCISKFLNEEYCLKNAVVVNINIKSNTIIIKTDEYDVEFITINNISNLNPGDKITIKYKFIIHQKKFMTTQPVIIFFSTKDDFKNNDLRFSRYTLVKNKLNEIYKTHHSELIKSKLIIKKIPKTIYRIGLIILETHLTVLDTFKKKFQSKCTGSIFVYKLKKDTIETDYINAINYFGKYHKIDLVCILTDRLELEHLFNLSSKYVLNNSKHLVYTVSVIYTNGLFTNAGNYLASYFTNKRNLSIDNVIDFIHEKQISHKIKTTNAICDGIVTLREIINAYDKRVLGLELLFAGSKIKKPMVDVFSVLKTNIVGLLDKELQKLIEIESNIIK